ncbi:2347_t:CDS:2 [Cetraspora pellucida]|uniref:2347_t:CDS:1 n=1 Tax=Cetraspora pellucida TaxID=1433469 RepID=A0ACA9KZ17_9GLOM|nr:2347_t:CDS:2 [Cetraspora pellucida]
MEKIVGGGEENDTQNNNPPSTETPNPPNISAFRQEAINTVEAALNLEPKIANSDLDEGCRQWKEQINAANDEKDIDNIKDRVNLQTEGKDAEALKKQLEEVEKAKGQQSYEDNQSAIDNLKNELAKKVSSEEYRQIIVETIEKTLTKYNIDANELDSEKITDQNQVNEIEKKVVKNAGEKGSQKKLALIFSESQQALKSGKAVEIKKAKNKLNNFMVSTDIYEKYLFSQREAEIKALLKELENYSSQKTTNPPSKFP